MAKPKDEFRQICRGASDAELLILFQAKMPWGESKELDQHLEFITTEMKRRGLEHWESYIRAHVVTYGISQVANYFKTRPAVIKLVTED